MSKPLFLNRIFEREVNSIIKRKALDQTFCENLEKSTISEVMQCSKLSIFLPPILVKVYNAPKNSKV